MSAPSTVYRDKSVGRARSFRLRSFPHLFLFASLGLPTVLLASNVTDHWSPAQFIEKHCAECHDDVSEEAGLDLLHLTFHPEQENNLAIWVKVHDRIKADEMPP